MFCFFVHSMYDDFKSIKLGRAAGLDGLAAENGVLLHDIICAHVSLLFAGILTQGYLSAPLMQSAIYIIPILKDRKNNKLCYCCCYCYRAF